LLGTLLGASFGPADKCLSASRWSRDVHFHGKNFAVLRALFLDQRITGLRTSCGVHNLLQRRLVIRDGQLAVALLLQFVKRRLQDRSDDEPVRRFDACIEKERSNQGFKCVYQQGVLGGSAAFVFGLAEAQRFADLQLTRGAR